MSHISSFPLAKSFAVGTVKSLWTVKTVFGILPEAVLYFMRQIYRSGSSHSWLNADPYRWFNCIIFHPDQRRIQVAL